MTDANLWWMITSLVAATAGIVFLATWTYKEDQRRQLLREQAADRNSENVELRNARIINQTFAAMRGVDVANMEER